MTYLLTTHQLYVAVTLIRPPGYAPFYSAPLLLTREVPDYAHSSVYWSCANNKGVVRICD